MQKVYLLLRSNQQTGPFSLEELVKFDLKPFDLIWIEGKSAGWYYPQEIEALKPYLSFVAKGDGLATVQSAPQAQPAQTSIAQPSQPVASQSVSTYTQPPAPKKVYVSMPTAVVAEQKPDVKKEFAPVNEAHQRYMPQPETKPVASTYAPQFASSTPSSTVTDKSELKTSYNKSLDDMETEYMNWMYQKKTKKKPLFSKSGIVVLGLLVVALTTVWYFANKPKTEATETSFQQPPVATPAVATPENTNTASDQQTSNSTNGASTNKKQRAAKHAVVQNTAAITTVTKPVKKAVMQHASNDIEMPIDNPRKNEVYKPSPVLKEESRPAPETQQPATTDAAPKKKLREKIYDLFHKKQQQQEGAPEESKPADNENGGRQSTRRESGSSLAQMVKVSFEIPNSWMMGVKGAKATLSNRSSETLAKAVIEVRYYNDDNELLDKRNITFSNVKSKQSQTVSIPEHNTATRLEYSVISAVGNEPVAMLR